MKETLNEANEDRDKLYADLGTVINQIDDLEQCTRKHNLEIHGMPEKTEENELNKLVHLEMHSMLRFDVTISTIATGCLRERTQVNPGRLLLD